MSDTAAATGGASPSSSSTTVKVRKTRAEASRRHSASRKDEQSLGTATDHLGNLLSPLVSLLVCYSFCFCYTVFLLHSFFTVFVTLRFCYTFFLTLFLLHCITVTLGLCHALFLLHCVSVTLCFYYTMFLLRSVFITLCFCYTLFSLIVFSMLPCYVLWEVERKIAF